MKPNAIASALSAQLAALKPAAPVAPPSQEKIFPDSPKSQLFLLRLTPPDLAALNRLLEAGRAAGRVKLNSTQAIRVAIRTAPVGDLAAIDSVMAEDPRRKTQRNARASAR